MKTLLELRDVSKRFRPPTVRQSLVKWLVARHPPHSEAEVLTSVSLTVRAGETVGIIGRNGSGKSTLLKIIAGILRPTSGSITAYGEILPILSWESCFIDDLEVSDNLCLFGALIGLTTSEVRSCCERIAERAGVAGRLDEQMRTFSPGMKARLALFLADEAKSEIVLLDETLSAGDAEFKQTSLKLLEAWKARGRAIVHVSHEMGLVEALSDRRLNLEHGALTEA